MSNKKLPDLLRTHRVFGHLDDTARADLAGRFAIEACPAGSPVLARGAPGGRLGMVLSGCISLEHEAGARITLLPGELIGPGAAPPTDAAAWQATAGPATQVAWLPTDDVVRLCAEHPALGWFMNPLPAQASSAADTGIPAGDPYLNLLSTPVRTLLRRPAVTLAPTASVLQAAQTMRDARVSSLLLLKDEHLFGLVTDRDLRNRALAAGLDPASPVMEIATLAPLCVDLAAPALDALLLMARHNVHHVPVLDGQRVAGMVTATDLAEHHTTSAVYLVGEIHKQTALPGLVESASRVKALQRNLVRADASAYNTGHIVTAVTDAVTARLIALAEAQLGPAPVDYAWVAAGSQAREEQTARSDQDNCLILADDYDEAQHGAYFRALADFVNHGLDACGYVYCPGEMMARTDRWRQPLRRWVEYFRGWTETPEPKALMLCCVFFDLRVVHGRAELLDQLRQEVLRRTRDNRIFLAFMAGNALTHRPPLTLFGGLATVTHEKRRDTIDLKHSGIVPIVDLARIYALAGGHAAVNTHDRLLVAADSKEISQRSAHDLRDALEFMGVLRLRHQAARIAQGLSADNHLSLSELSDFERSQLKQAFGVVQTLQSVLAKRYR